MAASMGSLMQQISRLAVRCRPLTQCTRTFTTQTHPLAFQATNVLNAQPQKKKKKIDIQLVQMREQRKMRKLEKAIRKLESRGRTLKPIPEIEGDRKIGKPREIEPLTEEEIERRALLYKSWCAYKSHQFKAEMEEIEKVFVCQQEALNELRAESEELYQAAIQLDSTLIPFDRTGPVETPPIPGFASVDGEYIDTTKVFDK